MQTTARRRILYPDPSRDDRPDIPAHLYDLAAALDADVLFNIGQDSDRQNANHQVGGGRFWWTTDTHILWFDDGAAWQQMGNAPLNSPQFTGSPQAPTQVPDDNSQSIATTAFVHSVIPAGVVMAYAAAAAPTGWLMCDGSAISRVTYAQLFAVIGTTHGSGNGTTTFNVPDLRTRVPVGYKAADANFGALGGVGGETTHTIVMAEMPSHSHTGNTYYETQTHTHSGVTSFQNQLHTHPFTYTAPFSGNTAVGSAGSGVTGTTTGSGSTSTESANHSHNFSTSSQSANHNHQIAAEGGGGAHNNLQPFITLNYLIKY